MAVMALAAAEASNTVLGATPPTLPTPSRPSANWVGWLSVRA